MMLDIGWLITLFAIGFIGSFISGMVGIGGSVINYPMLLYVPPALGFLAFSAQEVSSVSAVQVFFASLAGVLAYKKGGLVNKQLVLIMGIPIVIGSFTGAFLSRWLPDSAINVIYAVLALVAAVMMFFSKKGEDPGVSRKITFNKVTAAVAAAITGIASGIVGAAGAFITLPIMFVILKIPTRVAIASSLAITFISSIGTSVGKLAGGHVSLLPVIPLVIASLIASPLGAKFSKKLNTTILQWILAGLILITVLKIWMDILT